MEFGAIRINLALFAPAVRRYILDERVPLGHLLRVHSVRHSSRPKAFFRLHADPVMIRSLELTGPNCFTAGVTRCWIPCNGLWRRWWKSCPPATGKEAGFVG